MNNPIFNFSIEEDIKVEIYLQKVTIINKHIKQNINNYFM